MTTKEPHHGRRSRHNSRRSAPGRIPQTPRRGASRLADRLGLPPDRITAIVNGERAITPETAVLFGTVFGTTPEFWLNLQRRFDLQTASIPADRLQRARKLHEELVN